MKRIVLFWVLFISLMGNVPVLAADQSELNSKLQKLDISTGHWVYHGETMNTPSGKAGKWTWDEHCAWSQNREFMMCSFTNDWAGRTVKSLVVDTWSGKDKSFWHYEIFSSSGAKPFVSKMDISGNTRVEIAKSENHGKTNWTRITYVFDSATHVKVKLESSRDGTHWVTVDQGEGVKQA